MVMDFRELKNRLHDSNPRVRVETLRVLAMLEETRALENIVMVYKNDPDERVRHVAKWAGNIIWQAQERGHSTEAAIKAHFKRSTRPDLEQMVIDGATSDAASDPALSLRVEAARQQWDQVDAIKGESPFGKADDDTALLDAGLRDMF